MNVQGAGMRELASHTMSSSERTTTSKAKEKRRAEELQQFPGVSEERFFKSGGAHKLILSPPNAFWVTGSCRVVAFCGCGIVEFAVIRH